MTRSLEEQREEFARRRFIAMPIAGIIAWSIAGISGAFLPKIYAVWVLFISTGSIVYLGILISKFTGENFLDKKKDKNEFDTLFIYTVGMAVLVYSIAIPFFLVDYESLPLTVGILAGLMWVPFSWIVGHWVGIFHTLLRLVLVVAFWYLLPDSRFVAIPVVIIAVYFATIVILENRWRRLETG
ncbi:MAG TPA: hypothetical protein VFQ23_20840 [Anaerolineales bacterium]|nr:hypothetical protein [Anaerolineales bacterium]